MYNRTCQVQLSQIQYASPNDAPYRSRLITCKLVTMSRINELFKQKKNNILNVYCTAGYPQLNSTVPVMKALQDSGVDMIELGMPYSDPLADGPVIQASSTLGWPTGMTIATLFEQLRGFRQQIYVPVILMGYMNPILQYGFERLLSGCSRYAGRWPHITRSSGV